MEEELKRRFDNIDKKLKDLNDGLDLINSLMIVLNEKAINKI